MYIPSAKSKPLAKSSNSFCLLVGLLSPVAGVNGQGIGGGEWLRFYNLERKNRGEWLWFNNLERKNRGGLRFTTPREALQAMIGPQSVPPQNQ